MSKKIGIAILDYMAKMGYKITSRNIVYIEGVDPVEEEFRLNKDILDIWNDTRNLITDDGDFLISAVATTEPGRYYTMNPMVPQGAARIAFGQYLNAWKIGLHGVNYPHEALVQIEPVRIHRDLNKDGFRTNDAVFYDVIGLNQHTTSNAPRTIGHWSAGCLVGRYPSTHRKFMEYLKAISDTKFKTFHTTVLDGEYLHEIGVLG
jgi:hypothetical protein